MKHTLVERVLVAILLVVAAGIVVHAPLTVWLGTVWPDYALVIKAWKELLMGVAAVLLVVAYARRKRVDEFLRDRLVQIALVYAGLHLLILAVFQNGLQAAGAGLLIDLRFVLFFVLVYGTLALVPEFKRAFIWTFLAGAGVVFGFGILQLFILPRDFLTAIGYGKDTIAPFLTVDRNPDLVRISSTLRGPNPLGAYAVTVLSVLYAIYAKSNKKLSTSKYWLLVAGIVAGVLVLGTTYSRSSLLAFAVAFGVVIFVAVSRRWRVRLAWLAAAGVCVLLAFVFLARENTVVSNIFWHDNPNGGSAVDSNAGHAESLAEGLRRTVAQPFGAGVGSTGSASLLSDETLIIENQYLLVAHEVGWLGLGLFLWLFVEIMRRLWSRRKDALALGVFASGVGLVLIGLVLPVWVDDTVSIVWWGLAGVAIGYWKVEDSSGGGKKKHGA